MSTAWKGRLEDFADLHPNSGAREPIREICVSDDEENGLTESIVSISARAVYTWSYSMGSKIFQEDTRRKDLTP
jgi:hypothetical protein